MFIHRRGSTEQNTWTIDDQLFTAIMCSTPGSVLQVTNRKGKGIELTQRQVLTIWNSRGYLSSRSGHPIKVVRFPWHPLE